MHNSSILFPARFIYSLTVMAELCPSLFTAISLTATTSIIDVSLKRCCGLFHRFHPLSEFDEGKRSCRRRLAGHNRRRRKTLTEDVSSRISLSGNNDNNGNGDLDIVNLLTVLARAQGKKVG